MIKYYIGILVLSVVVVSALAWAFAEVGSPDDSRKVKFDETRSRDLSELKYTIDNMMYSRDTLPENLESITEKSWASKKDPETDQPYEYKKLSDREYQLCATFGTDSEKADAKRPMYSTPSSDSPDFYKHPKGYKCFDLKVADHIKPYTPPVYQ